MLDGAARIGDLFARPREHGHAGPRDHRPRLRLRRLRVLEEGRRRTGSSRSSASRPTSRRARTAPTGRGCSGATAARDDVSGSRRLHPHDAARREHDGMHNLFRLSSLASHRGLLLQAADGPRAAARPTARASSPPPAARRARCRPGSGSASTTRRVRRPREFRDIFGAENFFCELMDHGLDIERRVQKDLLRLAKDLEPAARRHQRPALHARRGRQGPRGAALRAVRLDARRPQPVQVRRRRASTSSPPAEMRQLFARAARGLRQHAAHRRALRRRVQHEGEDVHAALPRARRARTRTSWFVKEVETGLHERYPERHPRRRSASRPTTRSASSSADGLPRLLPRRRRLHQLGQGQRHPGRPGPWLRRRLDGAPTPCGSPTSTRCSTA